MISSSQSMAVVLLDNPGLLPLLSRFGIRLGFGDRSVEEICRANGANPVLFTEIANAFTDPDYEPTVDRSRISLGDIISYIRRTHTFYTEKEIPAIETEIERLIGTSALNEEHRRLLRDFFNDYRNEFLIHIRHEEEMVLPYILDLEQQLVGSSDAGDKYPGYSILEYAREHDRLENSLNDLAKLIIKYLPPLSDQDLCARILTMLFSLEKDLVEHAKLEDKVLVPWVLDLEQFKKRRH